MGQIFDPDEHKPDETISPAEDALPKQSDSGIAHTVTDVPVDTSLPQVAPPEKNVKNIKSHAMTATETNHSGRTKSAVKRSLPGEGPPAKKMTKDAPKTMQATLVVKADDKESTKGHIEFDRGLASSASGRLATLVVEADDEKSTKGHIEFYRGLASPASGRHRSRQSSTFKPNRCSSPVPSTSRDTSTPNSTDDDVEIIEVPRETIVLDNSPDLPTHRAIDVTENQDDAQLAGCYAADLDAGQPPVALQSRQIPIIHNPVSMMAQRCPICLESLGSQPLASTPCGHIFCMVCIQKAMKIPMGKKCPTCRKRLRKGQVHPIF